MKRDHHILGFGGAMVPRRYAQRRRPSLIRLGRRRVREGWAAVFLLVALFLAGLFNHLR
jgi:hypothetical protein